MSDVAFSIITTAKNENDKEMIRDVFNNWQLTVELFEAEIGTEDNVEIIIADAGGNARFPEISNCELKIISPDRYEAIRSKLYQSGVIKFRGWDTPSMGRNIGFAEGRPKGEIIIFQDTDSMFSAGSENDRLHLRSMDRYDNYLGVMHRAFNTKNIVAASPSLRPFDSKEHFRRKSVRGENFTTWFSTKMHPIHFGKYYVAGPSVPGCSLAVRRSTIEQFVEDSGSYGPYNPKIAIAEDYWLSRRLGEYGRISYEKRACAFIRTATRVTKESLMLWRALFYAAKWAPFYFFPGRGEYTRHNLSI
jgi:hypothetical protein